MPNASALRCAQLFFSERREKLLLPKNVFQFVWRRQTDVLLLLGKGKEGETSNRAKFVSQVEGEEDGEWEMWCRASMRRTEDLLSEHPECINTLSREDASSIARSTQTEYSKTGENC